MSRTNRTLSWVDYFNDGDPSYAPFKTWLAGLSDIRREMVEGEIEALLELAADGELDPSDTNSFEPVASLPDLYELKWRFRRQGESPIRLRQYHAEPTELPECLVALHRHVKDTTGSPTDVKDAQNMEMSKARLRFVAGQQTLWGTDP